LGLGFLIDDVMIGVGFAVFDDVIADPMSQFRVSKYYWSLGYNTSY